MDDAARLQLLLQIRRRWGDGPGGKVLQRLLELAFHEAGYRLVEERISEGIDFDVEFRNTPHNRYSFEARTTKKLSATVSIEDLRQMDQRMSDGYTAALAALRIAPSTRWVFVERSMLAVPSIRISIGTCPSFAGVAEVINQAFDGVLERHGQTAISSGHEGLQPHINKASE